MQFKVIEQYQEMFILDQPDETTKVIAARRPPTLIQSFAGVSLLSYLTVCRFADHLPYYRLEDILGRSGLFIDRSTQWRWMHRLAIGVTPLVDLMWTRVLQGHIIAMDETPVRELGGRGTTLTGYMWAGVGDAEHPVRLLLLHFRPSHGATARVPVWVSRLSSDGRVHCLRTSWRVCGRISSTPAVGRTVGANSKHAITWAPLRRRIRRWPSFVSCLTWRTCIDL